MHKVMGDGGSVKEETMQNNLVTDTPCEAVGVYVEKDVLREQPELILGGGPAGDPVVRAIPTGGVLLQGGDTENIADSPERIY